MYLVGVRGSQEYEALARYGQARVAAAQGKLIEARQHGHASLALLKSMEHYKVAEVEQWLGSGVRACNLEVANCACMENALISLCLFDVRYGGRC
jgi:hypothetical protein